MATATSTKRSKGAKGAKGAVEALSWPPKLGTDVTVYLGGNPVPYRAEVRSVQGSTMEISSPVGSGPIPTDDDLKLLFAGTEVGWGFDATIDSIDAGRNNWRLRILAGPMRIERRDSERISQRKIVRILHHGKLVPAHLLDRSDFGMRCIVGRGVRIEEAAQLRVEVDAAEDDVVDALVVWRKLTPRGVEMGLRVVGPGDLP